MKRFVVVPAVMLLALPAAAAFGGDETSDATTRTICHRTTSARAPYVKMSVTARQLRVHSRHAADIIPAPRGACPRTVLTASRGGTAITTNLVGETESPAGDPVSTGTATIRLRRGQGQVCYRIGVDNIRGPVVGAHIHVGAAGESGGIVVTFRAPGATGTSSGCAAASRTVVSRILTNASRYYVNVHTTEFPAGAVRGQLRTQADLGRTITAELTGAQETRNGDPDGTGSAVVRFRRADGQVCFRLTAQNITLPSVGAHIHRAPRGQDGGIVVQFTAPNASGVSSGCTATPQALIDEILANPSNFYVNVHTTERLAGAIRGQLG
jgi:hypothetical protein